MLLNGKGLASNCGETSFQNLGMADPRVSVDLHKQSIAHGHQKSSPKLANDLCRDMACPRCGAGSETWPLPGSTGCRWRKTPTCKPDTWGTQNSSPRFTCGLRGRELW